MADQTTTLPPVRAVAPGRLVAPGHITLEPWAAPVLRGVPGCALFWTRSAVLGEQEERLALTASGHAVFVDAVADAWAVVGAQEQQAAGDWRLGVQIVGLGMPSESEAANG